ncbi:MAG: PIN domain-containing protein [Anaerolineae bacterium]|nr:PIN domain-containing protein [Anaerolineae bacterium]
MYFIDTNILIYALCASESETNKANQALSILRKEDCALSIQVLQEFYVQATRPNRTQSLSHNEASAFIATLRRYPIQDNTLAVFQVALKIKERYQTSFWDASIIAAAKALNCGVILSEDLNRGQLYEGIRVINPFLEG